MCHLNDVLHLCTSGTMGATTLLAMLVAAGTVVGGAYAFALHPGR